MDMKLLKNRTAVCCGCTNGVALCRTLTWVCRSDKLRLVLNGGYAKNHPIRLCLPPLQRRGIPLFQQPHGVPLGTTLACWVVYALQNAISAVRNQIMQPICWVLARYWILIQRVPNPLHMLGTGAISTAVQHQIMFSINQMAQTVLHNVVPFVAIAQAVVLFFNSPILVWRLI